jgi:DNA-binding NtrC family response regulator
MHVLWVEDSAEELKLFSRFADRHVIEHAQPGEDAIERLSEREWDVIVTDYRHAGDVEAFIAEAREAHPDARIFIFSGSPPASPVPGATSVTKPINLDKIGAAVRGMLAG